MKTRSFFSGLLLLACANLFSSCSGLSVARQNDGKGTKPPVPRTAPAEDTEVAYVRQKGKWYQFRMKLEDKGPTAKDEYDSYNLHFKAEASVWQFNPKSGEYDAPVSQGARPSSTQGLRFSFNSGKELKLNMSAGNGGAGGGSAGWPNENFTDAKIVIDPSSFSQLSFDDEQFFEVRAIATMKPTAKEKKKGAQPLQVIAKQNWKVEIVPPHKNAKFTRVD